VAWELEVSRQGVSRWYADWQAKGTRDLADAGRAERLPKLDAAQLGRVAQELAKGAGAAVTRLSRALAAPPPSGNPSVPCFPRPSSPAHHRLWMRGLWCKGCRLATLRRVRDFHAQAGRAVPAL
jgi:hypothetical protein